MCAVGKGWSHVAIWFHPRGNLDVADLWNNNASILVLYPRISVRPLLLPSASTRQETQLTCAATLLFALHHPEVSGDWERLPPLPTPRGLQSVSLSLGLWHTFRLIGFGFPDDLNWVHTWTACNLPPFVSFLPVCFIAARCFSLSDAP